LRARGGEGPTGLEHAQPVRKDLQNCTASEERAARDRRACRAAPDRELARARRPRNLSQPVSALPGHKREGERTRERPGVGVRSVLSRTGPLASGSAQIPRAPPSACSLRTTRTGRSRCVLGQRMCTMWKEGEPGRARSSSPSPQPTPVRVCPACAIRPCAHKGAKGGRTPFFAIATAIDTIAPCPGIALASSKWMVVCFGAAARAIGAGRESP
jgi:hypothetical protein